MACSSAAPWAPPARCAAAAAVPSDSADPCEPKTGAIRLANTDAVMLPITATPSTLPMLRVVSLTAEPTPAIVSGSSCMDAAVAADMASPIPAQTMTMARM